jgi:hypothetical protein
MDRRADAALAAVQHDVRVAVAARGVANAAPRLGGVEAVEQDGYGWKPARDETCRIVRDAGKSGTELYVRAGQNPPLAAAQVNAGEHDVRD